MNDNAELEGSVIILDTLTLVLEKVKVCHYYPSFHE